MTKEQKEICRLIAKALFGKEYAPAEGISWEEVYSECIRQTILAVVVGEIPAEAPFSVRIKWINAAGVHAASNDRTEEGHYLIHQLLESAGIPYTTLKGMATQSYYPDPEMRTLGDVDFLIRKEDADRCDTLLREKGFQAEANQLPYEWGYRRNGLEYELHLSVNGIPEGKAAAVTEGYLSGMIEASQVTDAFAKPFRVPDVFRHGLVILLHTAKHMVGEGVGFRQICDWAVFAAHLGEEFPAMFQEPLQKIGIWRYALVLSAVCSVYIGMPAYSWIPAYDPAFLDTVMEDLIRKGNFRRTADSGVDTILVEKTDSGGVAEGSMVKQLLKNLGQKVKYKWPVMNRAKILIPFGVMVMCAQYAAGSMTGKYKKIDPKKMIGEAKQRRELYEELALFRETEDQT